MALAHDGVEIPGIVRPHGHPTWNFQETLIQIFGREGTIVLQGGRSHREFTVPIWFYNEYSQVQLIAALDTLHDRIGAIGSLVYTGAIERTLTDVEFLDCDEVSSFIPPNPTIGWSVDLNLKFRQLAP